MWVDGLCGERRAKELHMSPNHENRLQEGKFGFVWLKAQGVKGVLRGTRNFECHISPKCFQHSVDWTNVCWLAVCFCSVQQALWHYTGGPDMPCRYLGDRKPGYVTEF